MFEDLVGETASELLIRFKAAQDDYFDLVPERRAKDSLELSTQHLHELVAFMYDHFDEFKLILCRAEGTGYADFIVDRRECCASENRKEQRRVQSRRWLQPWRRRLQSRRIQQAIIRVPFHRVKPD